jgi:hypothetical protein
VDSVKFAETGDRGRRANACTDPDPDAGAGVADRHANTHAQPNANSYLNTKSGSDT